MITLCMYCGRLIGSDKPGEGVSHGICDCCFDAWKNWFDGTEE